MHRIAVLGSPSFDLLQKDVEIRCFEWITLEGLLDSVGVRVSLRDYDTVIVNLTDSNKAIRGFACDALYSQFPLEHLHAVLVSGGHVIYVGDPSIQSNDKRVIIHSALRIFDWDLTEGDRVISTDNGKVGFLKDYLKNVTRYDASIKGYKLPTADPFASVKTGHEEKSVYALASCTHATTLFENSIAVTCELQRYTSYSRRPSARFNSKTLGSISYFPTSNLPWEDTLRPILRDVVGLKLNGEPPDWIRSKIAPGEGTIDEKITDARAKIHKIEAEIASLDHERSIKRQQLGLLYDMGDTLQATVWKALCNLGADIEEPIESNKEDGWISVEVGSQLFEGVLEVKSTANKTFTEQSLRQVSEWKDRGRIMRHKTYKGIVVGGADVGTPPEERQSPFSPSYIGSAELGEVAVIKADDLFHILELDSQSLLDRDAFWRLVFSTKGIVNFDSLESI